MKLPVVRELVMGGAGLALFGTVVASAIQGPFDPKSEMIFVGEKAIALLPPVVAAKGDPKTTAWSSDGKWLFIESEEMKIEPKVITDFISQGKPPVRPPIPEVVLTFFDAEKLTSREVARFRANGTNLYQVSWLPGDRFVAFVVNEPMTRNDGSQGIAQSLYLANPISGKVSRILRASETQAFALHAEPHSKGMVVSIRDFVVGPATEGIPGPPKGYTVQWLGIDGKLGNTVRVEEAYHREIFWSDAGAPYLARTVADPRSKTRTVEFFRLDFARNAVASAAQPNFLEPSKGLGYDVMLGGSMSVAETAQVTRRSLWLRSHEKSEYQLALIAADVDKNALSPSGSGVFYESKGIGLVRPLITMPKDAALNALNAAERARAISDAKQAGLALIMYATDYDDTFPSNAGDWAEAVNPYLKNREILDGFTYTYSGGPMSEIEKPAETEIGYKIGPGGRAVAYADGHVKWIPNPKKEQNLSALTRPCFGALLGSMPQGSPPSLSSA